MTLKITTRLALSDDYDWLYKLSQEVYHDLITLEFGHWDEDEELGLFQKAWDTQTIHLILADQQRAGMYILDQHKSYYWLSEIQITAHFQNQGIGTNIIKRLINDTHKQEVPLRLRVLHANYRAYHLYQRLGFKRISSAQHHHVMEIK